MLKQKFVGVNWETSMIDQTNPFNTGLSVKRYTIRNMFVAVHDADIKIEKRPQDLAIVIYNKNMRHTRLLFSSTAELDAYFTTYFQVI